MSIRCWPPTSGVSLAAFTGSRSSWPPISAGSRLRQPLPFASDARLRCTPAPLPSSCCSKFGVEAKVSSQQSGGELRTCRTCKKMFNSSQNNPRACRFHTAHFGGETRRKFESVHSGGTMNTVGGGNITQYWHCCGSEDPLDPGCEAAPHSTYDDP